MPSMTFAKYFDKVYGCWLGKCVCGSIGAPLEGCKQLFDYKFNPAFWKIAVPNDDLEIQILWLNLVERLGFDFDSEDLAGAFCSHVTYNYGEYGYFKRNFRRGIHTPDAGTYNNRYYHEGMGCTVRGEIWACLAAGDPKLAAKIALHDGQLDHGGEARYSEQFMVAMEAMAFLTSDLGKIIGAGLSVVPAASKFAALVRDVLCWSKATRDWRDAFKSLIKHYGHPDCTNVYQNFGIILLALLHSGKDIEKATVIAMNCGYDADSTCGQVGSLLGIIIGADKLQRRYGAHDTGYSTLFEVNRPTASIKDLAYDIARLAPASGAFWKRQLSITEVPPQVAAVRVPKRARRLSFKVGYDALPVILPGGGVSCKLTITNLLNVTITGSLKFNSSDLKVDSPYNELSLKPGEKKTLALKGRHGDGKCIASANRVTVSFGGECFTFGFSGATPWLVYGPFWENVQTLPQIKIGQEGYREYIKPGNYGNVFTATRNYHLNAVAKLSDVPLDENALAKGNLKVQPDATIYALEDLIPIDASCGYMGPALFYLVSEFELACDAEVQIALGHSGPLAFWLDGEELARQDRETWWTAENICLDKRPLKAGRHRVLLKAIRQGAALTLSINYRGTDGLSKEFDDAYLTNIKYHLPEIISTVRKRNKK